MCDKVIIMDDKFDNRADDPWVDKPVLQAKLYKLRIIILFNYFHTNDLC